MNKVSTVQYTSEILIVLRHKYKLSLLAEVSERQQETQISNRQRHSETPRDADARKGHSQTNKSKGTDG